MVKKKFDFNESDFPGLEISDISSIHDHPLSKISSSIDGWSDIHRETELELKKFIHLYSPEHILCLISLYQISQTETAKYDWSVNSLQQADVEVLQAMIISVGRSKISVPAAPRKIEKLADCINRNVFSFLAKQPNKHRKEHPEKEYVLRKLRQQTVYRRNFFLSEDCENAVMTVARGYDKHFSGQIDVKASDAALIIYRTGHIVNGRLSRFIGILNNVKSSETAEAIYEYIKEIRTSNRYTERACKWLESHKCDMEMRKYLAIQIIFLAASWVFTIKLSDIEEVSNETSERVLRKLSYSWDEGVSFDVNRIYMDNPVWVKPYIRLENGDYLLPVPGIPYGVPFKLLEQFILNNKVSREIYSSERAKYLEEELERTVRTSLPHARVYRSVEWSDPDSGKTYENDVVAIWGNSIFLFEAKSGKRDEAAQRGAERSLERNFRDLFVHPAEQAARLEAYINMNREKAILKEKGGGAALQLDLTTAKRIYKFSICIEHFWTLTSNKLFLEKLEMVGAADPWSPVLSIGDLRMAAFLNESDIALHHYLVRRANLEEYVNFVGDEQDIISTYLINRLCIDYTKIDDRVVVFREMDIVAHEKRYEIMSRREKSSDNFRVSGFPLSDFWRRIVKEVHKKGGRNSVDIIEAILSITSDNLMVMESGVNAWRRRSLKRPKNKDIIVAKNEYGRRVYAISWYFIKDFTSDEDVKAQIRNIAHTFAGSIGVTEMVVFLATKGGSATYDGVSFFRFDVKGRE